MCLIVLSLKVTGMTFRTILSTSQTTHRASITKVTPKYETHQKIVWGKLLNVNAGGIYSAHRAFMC